MAVVSNGFFDKDGMANLKTVLIDEDRNVKVERSRRSFNATTFGALSKNYPDNSLIAPDQ
jgi:hypothetical protein